MTSQTQNTLLSLWQTGFDRAFGTGDVQAFDLGPVRDGKVQDGADLKASATFSIAGEVRGLELADDGKFLTAAVSKKVGASYKSWLRLYDTGERKFVKEVALPEPCSDMRKSMDGQRLLVLGFPANDKVEATSVMAYNPTTLEAGKKFRSPGGSPTSPPGRTGAWWWPSPGRTAA